MNRHDNDSLIEKLRSLPTPDLDDNKSEQIRKQLKMESAKGRKFKPFFAGVAGILSFALFIFLAISMNTSPPAKQQSDVSNQQVQTKNSHQDPEKIVNKWAEAVKKRDGKAQFSLFASETQAKVKTKFEKVNWVTGTSSPWVESYTIKEVGVSPQKTIFTVQFKMASSNGETGSEKVQVILIPKDGQWVITNTLSNTNEFHLNILLNGKNQENPSQDTYQQLWEQLSRLRRVEGQIIDFNEKADPKTVTIKVMHNLPYDNDPVDYPVPGYTVKLNLIEETNRGDAGDLVGQLKEGATMITSFGSYAKKADGTKVNDGTFYADMYIEKDGLFYDAKGLAKAFLDATSIPSAVLKAAKPVGKKVKSFAIKGSSAKVALYEDNDDVYAFIDEAGQHYAIGKIGSNGSKNIQVDQDSFRLDELKNPILIKDNQQIRIIGYSNKTWKQYLKLNQAQLVNIDGVNDDEIVDISNKNRTVIYRWIWKKDQFVKMDLAESTSQKVARFVETQRNIQLGPNVQTLRTMTYSGIGTQIFGELTELNEMKGLKGND